MKRIVFCLCFLVVALTSCDPGFVDDYRLNNNSGHKVTFSSTSSSSNQSFWNDHPNGVIIENGEDSLFYSFEALGTAELDYAEQILSLCVYGDTITFTFDDGRQLVFTKEEGNGPFDFEGDHYSWTTKRGHIFLMYYDQYGCLTYTITREDYENSIEP